jgi:glycosyltransferase involved in cell wall biosynthesis
MEDREMTSRAHPLVSVVVPTMRRPEMLRQALIGILQQDYAGPIEIIVVFDHVEPEMPDLEVPARRELSCLVNQRTRGLAGNRNTGIVATKGEFVAFCDDDDVWEPSKLTEQVAALQRSDRHFLASTGIIAVRPGQPDVERVLPFDEVTHPMFLRSRLMEVHSSTLLFRREALVERVGLVDEQLPGGFGEDHEILLRASALAPVLLVPKALVRVDMHPKSYFSEQWGTMVDACNYMIERHPDLLSDRKSAGRIYGRIALAKAALREHKAAWRYIFMSIREWPLHPRPFIALLINLRLLTPNAAVRLANRLGRGV